MQSSACSSRATATLAWPCDLPHARIRHPNSRWQTHAETETLRRSETCHSPFGYPTSMSTSFAPKASNGGIHAVARIQESGITIYITYGCVFITQGLAAECAE